MNILNSCLSKSFVLIFKMLCPNQVPVYLMFCMSMYNNHKRTLRYVQDKKSKWHSRLSFTFKGLLGPCYNLFRRITAQITSRMLSFAVSALVQAPLKNYMYQYYYHININVKQVCTGSIWLSVHAILCRHNQISALLKPVPLFDPEHLYCNE